MAVPQSDLQFRRISIEKLQYPDALFDERSIPANSTPEMITPLIVYEKENTFTVIDGCKRLFFARSSGMEACNCALISPSPDEHHAALLRITLNRSRPLHFFEKLLFIHRLKTQSTAIEYTQLSKTVVSNRKELLDFERMIECDPVVIDAVADGRLEAAYASEVQQFSLDDRETVISLFRQYSFTRQMQRELLDWLPECAFREKSTITRLLAESWIQEIHHIEKLNGPQKIDRIRTALFDQRFPTVARAKKVWSESAAELNPDPSHVHFKPSEAFEKNRLELRITVTSAEQASAIFSALHNVALEKWDQLIYPAQFYTTGKSDS